MRIAAVVCVVTACTSPGRGRFPDRAPLLREPEKTFFPPPPKWEATDRGSATDDQVFYEWDQRMALEPTLPAQNVNSLDEAPASPVSVNRIARATATAARHA